jgi:hypothetical protein
MVCGLSLVVALNAGAGLAEVGDAARTDAAQTHGLRPHGLRLTTGFQGFSVESADFAHGFLTRERMAQRLRTLGRHGVIRLGGYSMDLVWPAFGAWRDVPAPAEAIGGTVDQADLDALADLLDATGWKVTLGAPLKSVIDPSKVKNPTRDPAPDVSLEQVVAEVRAAYETLGDDLLAVELGNEYDNVTTLTGAELWETAKQYRSAIEAALPPHARLRISGPSANTSPANARLDEFVTAALADESTRPADVLGELASHWYPWSHCGSRVVTIEQLMSEETSVTTAAKLDGIVAAADRLRGGSPGRIPVTLNESNSASCSGMPEVSNSYASSLWSLDYLLQAAASGIDRLQFHTNTAAICGDFKPRESPEYPISYRYYGAFCAADQDALDSDELSASPLYYGIWAFRHVPTGEFVDLDVAGADPTGARVHAVRGEDGTLTVVAVNVHDPAAAGSGDEVLTVRLPSAYRKGTSLTLRSSDPAGLASLDAGRITFGGRTVAPDGAPAGRVESTDVRVRHGKATSTVAAGSAQVITFRR